MAEAKLKAAFDECDLDRSGKISVPELRTVLKHMGYDRQKAKITAEAMVKALDKNGDGEVSWNEFKAALKNNNQE